MAEASDQATSVCSHCARIIPFSNIVLHHAHCSRNLVKCKICGDMVPGKLIKEHFLGTHATVICSIAVTGIAVLLGLVFIGRKRL